MLALWLIHQRGWKLLSGLKSLGLMKRGCISGVCRRCRNGLGSIPAGQVPDKSVSVKREKQIKWEGLRVSGSVWDTQLWLTTVMQWGEGLWQMTSSVGHEHVCGYGVSHMMGDDAGQGVQLSPLKSFFQILPYFNLNIFLSTFYKLTAPLLEQRFD